MFNIRFIKLDLIKQVVLEFRVKQTNSKFNLIFLIDGIT